MWSQVGLRKHYHKQSSWRWWTSNWAIPGPKRWCCESATLSRPANSESTAVPTGLEKAIFHSNPKEDNAKECSKYCTVTLRSHARKVMLKILPARLQQYMNWELPDVQAEFRKGRDQIAYLSWIIGKERKFEKNIYFCFINYAKAFDCVVHTQSKREREWERERERNLGKILKEMGEPDYLTCLLRTLYVDQEAIVRTRYGTMDWFKVGQGVCQGYN